ncbi:OmpA family protein [Hyphococcus sp.]|uniref:OmpA family protein n=1 Tax=Hyphococcus sp. TaxID=2038636 RepID=UPI003D13AE10
MNAVLKFLLGFLAVAALGAAAVTMEGTPGSAASAQARLQEKADEILTDDNIEWASVRLDGQKAVLFGTAPSEEARAALIARVAETAGPGGLVSGGVTAVDASRLVISPPLPRAEPFIFIAEREGGVVTFSGNVPDQATRDEIYRLAAGLFPDAEISGVIDIADGAPAPADMWLDAAAASLRALSHLRSGVAEANDGVFTVTGEAEDETRAAASRTLMSDLRDGLDGETRISIRKPPASIEDIITQAEEEAADQSADAPEEQTSFSPEDETLTEIPIDEMAGAAESAAPEVDCAEPLAEAINARRIGFTSARADIDNPSRDQLRRVARLLADCPEVRLAITGHTDSSGSAARNRQLSGYRADAVRAFLISVGIAEERVTARGAGSAEPIANNATPAGREQNRRIEIEIIRQE